MKLDKRLRYARERAGLTLQQIFDRTGIGVSSLSDYENGHREPSVSQLASLAKIYHRPFDFFFESGTVSKEIVLWRERAPFEKVKEFEVQFLELCRQYHSLEAWTGAESPCRLPYHQFNAAAFGRSDAEKLAYEVRNHLGLGDRPGPQLLRTLEEAAGLKVFHLDFEPDGNAASTVGDFGPAVLLNSRNDRRCRTVGLGHELFHVLTWDTFRSQSETAAPAEEELAERFARHLLVPDEPLKAALGSRIEVGRVKLSELIGAARQFDVPAEIILRRSCELCSRSDADVERLVLQFRSAGRRDESDQGEVPTRPQRFVHLAENAYGQGEMSLGRLAEYLGITRGEASRRYVDRNVSEDEEVVLK